ncbi:PAS domain S-box protein [Tepidiphilus sp. B18-69]|uniref:histidine kinase n=1 Tax=Tepidiphilus baoligensis TaxID=2698687 RepID=A0ABX1QRN9_9PROT|nr:PAS domain S-box protein [Tepidiphilus baoligensis]NMH17485.1 PAS domain S-box protein [Tepidiphilus baoligensis]
MTADPAEIARLTALERLDIYGTLPEPTFDRVVELAASLLEVPIALLSFIGKDTLRVKARFGSALEVLPRQESFCTFLIESDSGSLLVEDARQDPRFASIPLVTSGRIRFYFGLAIRVEGQPVGTLCVMDTQVRHLSSVQERSLRHLVALTEEMLMARRRAIDYRKAMRRHEATVNELRAILDTAAAGIVRIDANGYIQAFNRAAERLFGYAREEVIGRNVSLLMPSPWAQQHDEYLARYRRTREARIIGIGREVRGRRADGSEFPMHLAVSEVNFGGEPQYVGILSDTSALHSVLDAALEAAHRANRAKSEFVSNMSHELRSPLTSILKFSQLLLQGTREPLSERQRRHVAQIHRSGQHLLALVDDVLDLVRIEAGRIALSIEPVSLRALLDEALELVAPLAEEHGISLIDETQGQRLGQVQADFTRAKQVLVNLLSNAIKYNRPHGEVRLHACLREEETSPIKQWEIAVTDTGIGIDPSHLDHLFEPFNRLGRKTAPSRAPASGSPSPMSSSSAWAGRCGWKVVWARGVPSPLLWRRPTRVLLAGSPLP